MLYSMAHFGTVAVLGIENGIFNIPTLIYQRIHQSAGSFDSIRTGTVLATVLVVTAALIIWLQGKILSKGHYQIIGGKSFRPMELKLRALRVPLLVLCLVYIAFTIVLPTAVIFLVGGLKTYGLPFTWANLSLDNYKFILFDYKLTKDAIWNSVTLGLGAAVITMFAGVMISYVIVKMKVRGKGILEFLGMLPFSVPGSVIALGVILAWSGQYGINLYNTVWIILLAYIARYMGFSLKANSAAPGTGARLLGGGGPLLRRYHVADTKVYSVAPCTSRNAGGLLSDLSPLSEGTDCVHHALFANHPVPSELPYTH